MKKIMFNDTYALTAAVLNGSKTQTRRIVSDKLLSRYGHNRFNDRSTDLISNAPFNVGEVVAVAQCYEDAILDVGEEEWNKRHKWYNINYLCHEKGLHNKMFVKADLMPHQIEITDIRVQRLQDISDEDCIAEGIMRFSDRFTGDIVYSFQGCGYNFDYPITAYSELIDNISGKGTFERNPWVFRYTFKLTK